MNEFRQREGNLPQLVRALGSLELAMLLLGVLVIGCAAATFAESRFDAGVARAYIYDAPWFLAWLFLLCLNLLFAALSRWPWQRCHVGFVITHFGIITLLAGAWVGRTFGTEGFVDLQKGGHPLNRLTTGEMTVLARSPKTGFTYSLEYDPSARKPNEKRPRTLVLPDTDLRLKVDRWSARLGTFAELVAAPAGEGAPGIAIRLKSSMMPRPIEAQLLMGNPETSNFDLFGMGAIQWAEKIPTAPSKGAPLTLRLAPLGGGKIAWQSWRSGKLAGKGVSAEGKTFATGWADWQAEILRLLPSARLDERVEEMPADNAHDGSAPSGVRARLVAPSGRTGAHGWITDGNWRDLSVDTRVVSIGFGVRTVNLPFYIQLESFEVPRTEGTDRPENFISMVSFRDDPHQEGRRARIEMNRPGEHPTSGWRSALGLNYKF